MSSGSKDGTVRVWSLKDRHQIAILQGHLNSVECVAISKDGQYAISASVDSTLRLWNLKNKSQEAILLFFITFDFSVAIICGSIFFLLIFLHVLGFMNSRFVLFLKVLVLKSLSFLSCSISFFKIFPFFYKFDLFFYRLVLNKIKVSFDHDLHTQKYQLQLYQPYLFFSSIILFQVSGKSYQKSLFLSFNC